MIWCADGEDELYQSIRNDVCYQDLKDAIARAYDEVKEFLDSDFLREFSTHFLDRYFELCLAKELNTKFQLLPKPKGIDLDFYVQLQNKQKVWIEATRAQVNKSALKAESREEVNNMTSDIEIDAMHPQASVLRFTNSLSKKVEQVGKYRDKIDKNDYILIAVLGYREADISTNSDFSLPAFLRAVYPLGEQQVTDLLHQSKQNHGYELTSPIERYITKRGHKGPAPIPKNIIYPGDNYPLLDGVIFIEATNVQQLWGCFKINDKYPNLFLRYNNRTIPDKLTQHFTYWTMKQGDDNLRIYSWQPHDRLSASCRIQCYCIILKSSSILHEFTGMFAFIVLIII